MPARSIDIANAPRLLDDAALGHPRHERLEVAPINLARRGKYAVIAATPACVLHAGVHVDRGRAGDHWYPLSATASISSSRFTSGDHALTFARSSSRW